MEARAEWRELALTMAAIHAREASIEDGAVTLTFRVHVQGGLLGKWQDAVVVDRGLVDFGEEWNDDERGE